MSERPTFVETPKPQEFDDQKVKRIAVALLNQIKEKQANSDYSPDESYLHGLIKEAREHIAKQRQEARVMLAEAVSEGIPQAEMQKDLDQHLLEYERFETLLDRVEEMFPTKENVARKPFEEWKRSLADDDDIKRLDEAVRNAAFTPGDTSTLIADKQNELTNAIENLRQKITEKAAPVKDKFEGEAIKEIQNRIDQALLPLSLLETRREELQKKAFVEWKANLDPKIKQVEAALMAAEIDPKDSSADLDTKETALARVLDTLNTETSAIVASLDVKYEADVLKIISPWTEKVNAQLNKIKARKAELLGQSVEGKKSIAIATIKDIVGTPLTDELVASRAKADGISPVEYLQRLKKQLDVQLAEVAAIDKTFSPLEFGQRAYDLLNSLLEIQEILHMSYPELVEELLKATENIDPYISNPQMISDKRSRLLVNRFQQFSPEGLTGQEKLAFHRARIKIFCQRYEIVNGGTENMPAADTDKLYELMDPKNWGLTRVDILSFTNDETPGINGRSVGENVQEMLKYLVETVAKREGRTGSATGFEPKTGEKDITYTEAIQTKGGKNPKERLRAFAKKKFVEDEKKLTEDQFDIAWKLYYTFDLFGISLALRQKWTQTRAHNTHQKNDPNYLTRPFHVGAHKLNRYGNDANSLLWLTAFSSKYPDEWAYSLISDPLNHYKNEGIQEGQKLIIKFKEAGGPVDGVVGMVNPDPRVPGSEYAFCRWWDQTVPEKKGDPYLWKEEWDKLSIREKNNRFTKAKRKFVLQCSDPEEIPQEVRERAAHGTLKPEDERLLDGLYTTRVGYYYLRQWDKPIFPDHLEFLISPLHKDNNPENPESLANFNTAQKGWEKLLDTAIGELKTPDGKVTYDAIFAEGGLWDQFVGGGLGLAKLVPGNHKKLFAPLTRDFIARIGAMFVPDPGKSPVEERKRLTGQLIRSLKQATKEGEGGLSGLEGFDEIIYELEQHAKGKYAFKIWSVVPDMLRPESIRIREYEELVCATFEHKYKKPAPVGKFGIMWRIPATGIIPGVQYNQDELKDFQDMMNRIEFPERPASRKKDTDTTAKK